MLEDILIGAMAGAIGVWVMDRVGWFMYRREDSQVLEQERKARVNGLDVAHVAANRIANVFGIKLSPPQPHPFGLALHYSLGILPGALLGALLSQVGELRIGYGLLYGFILFILLDEVTAPVLGLASGPTKYPLQAHVRGLVSHLALGVATYYAYIALSSLF